MRRSTAIVFVLSFATACSFHASYSTRGRSRSSPSQPGTSGDSAAKAAAPSAPASTSEPMGDSEPDLAEAEPGAQHAADVEAMPQSIDINSKCPHALTLWLGRTPNADGQGLAFSGPSTQTATRNGDG